MSDKRGTDPRMKNRPTLQPTLVARLLEQRHMILCHPGKNRCDC